MEWCSWTFTVLRWNVSPLYDWALFPLYSMCENGSNSDYLENGHKTLSHITSSPTQKRAAQFPYERCSQCGQSSRKLFWGQLTSNGEKSYTCWSPGLCSYAGHCAAKRLPEELCGAWGVPATKTQPQTDWGVLMIQSWSCSAESWFTEKSVLQWHFAPSTHRWFQWVCIRLSMRAYNKWHTHIIK